MVAPGWMCAFRARARLPDAEEGGASWSFSEVELDRRLQMVVPPEPVQGVGVVVRREQTCHQLDGPALPHPPTRLDGAEGHPACIRFAGLDALGLEANLNPRGQPRGCDNK